MDVYAAVEVSYYYSKLIGLSPYRLVGKPPNDRRFEIRKYGYAYSISVIILILTLNGVINSFLVDKNQTQSSIVASVIVVQYHLDFIVCILALVRGCLTANRVVTFFSCIDRIDKQLKAMHIAVSYAIQRKYSILQAILIWVTAAGAVYYINYARTSFPYMKTFWWRMFWSFFFIPKIICAIFNNSFIEGVTIVCTRFKLLNETLAKMLGEARLRCVVAWVDKSSGSSSKTQSLELVSASHVELCELAKEHNSIYSFQTLFYIASAFTTMTTRLNSVVRDVTAKDFDPHQLFGHSAFSLCLLTFYAVQIVWLAVACTLCANEANKSATLVHKLLNHTDNENLKEKLHFFSMQLLHHKLQFTACYMFPLDATLIYAIVGGVTTYLVILSQIEVAPSGSQAVHLFNNTG